MKSHAEEVKRGLKWLAKNDEKLGALIKAVGACTLAPVKTFKPFEALLRSITHQQLTGKAAETILGRVKDRVASGKWPTPEQVRDVEFDVLRGSGLSNAKTLAVKDLAEKTLSGVVPSSRVLHRLGDEEIIERLTQVRGIGRWTVEMTLMFRLGRLDVLPIDDYGVRKGFTVWYKKREHVKPKALAAYAEIWRPYRTLASWYLWRALEL